MSEKIEQKIVLFKANDGQLYGTEEQAKNHEADLDDLGKRAKEAAEWADYQFKHTRKAPFELEDAGDLHYAGLMWVDSPEAYLKVFDEKPNDGARIPGWFIHRYHDEGCHRWFSIYEAGEILGRLNRAANDIRSAISSTEES